MILSRVIEHFRKQEWTAIFLDFIIVVAGVFIGMQVSNWNEVRKDRAEESVFLDGLEEEMAANADATRRVLNTHREREQTIRNVVRALKSDTDALPDESKIQDALCRWFVVPASTIATHRFDELVSTGKLDLIRDIEVRRLIMAAYAAHARSGYQIDLLTDAVRDRATGISQYVLWELGEGEGRLAGYRCKFDFDGIAKDPVAMSYLVQLARGQGNYAYFRQHEADADMAALQRLRPSERDAP